MLQNRKHTSVDRPLIRHCAILLMHRDIRQNTLSIRHQYTRRRHFDMLCEHSLSTIGTTQNPLKKQSSLMPGPQIETVRQHIAWSYANLARAHAAVEAGFESYGRTHHMIRSRLYKGLTTNAMKMRTLYDDEKVKLTHPQACCYCGDRKTQY